MLAQLFSTFFRIVEALFRWLSMKPIIFIENTMSQHAIVSESAGSRTFCDQFAAVMCHLFTPLIGPSKQLIDLLAT